MSTLPRIGSLLLSILLGGFICRAQLITIRCKEVPLRQIMLAIERQTDYTFVYQRSVVEAFGTVSMDVKDQTFTAVMDTLFKGTRFDYKVFGTLCSVIMKVPKCLSVRGIVMNGSGEPLVWATVFRDQIPLTKTDENGKFSLHGVPVGSVLSFSCIGYETTNFKFEGQPSIAVRLVGASASLDPVSVKGYSEKIEVRSTGDYTKIDNELLNRRVSTNIIDRLEGLATGLLIRQSSGIPGSAYGIQIRGQSGIGIIPGKLAFNEPMVVVDGIPFAANTNSFSGNTPVNTMQSMPVSPLATLNPNDIESIEVLKDADATALYGTRGVNGVILINTKKGKSGKPRLDLKASSGICQVSRLPAMLNMQQYAAMRRDALKLENSLPSLVNAPDLVACDTASAIDLRRELVKALAGRHDVQVAFSGGTSTTQYYFSGGYHQEGSVLPGNEDFSRKSVHGHITHKSANGKLSADLVTMLTASDNEMVDANISTLYLPPNSLLALDTVGRIPYNSQLHIINCMYRGQVNYRLSSPLQIITSFGFNRLLSDRSASTVAFLQPASPDRQFAGHSYSNAFESWIVEPQLQYTKTVNRSKYSWLLGTTVQQGRQRGPVDSSNGYVGYYSRAGFQYKDRYQMNVTVRVDGSTRLRRGDRFGTFGAIGASWVLSNEPFFKKSLPAVKYTKLKLSYGTSGNDEIDMLNASNIWPTVNNIGRGTTFSSKLAGADYTWEISRKLELGMELDLLRMVTLSLSAYRNRIGNQVIGYQDRGQRIPGVTARNSSAIVQNQGLELSLQLKRDKPGPLHWQSRFILTIPRNKLLAFPNLASSLYAGALVVGRPLSVQQGYRYTGVNPATGLFEVADLNGDGRINTSDHTVLGDLDPKLYGSIDGTLQYKRWELNVYFVGKVQQGYSQLYQVYLYGRPGTDMMNVPADFLNRWRKPGDNSQVQRLAARNDWQAAQAINNFLQSDGWLTSASYLRLKNIYLSYNLPDGVNSVKFVKALRCHLTIENLFTITGYKGTDPETQHLFLLPPLRTVVAGVQISF